MSEQRTQCGLYDGLIIPPGDRYDFANHPELKYLGCEVIRTSFASGIRHSHEIGFPDAERTLEITDVRWFLCESNQTGKQGREAISCAFKIDSLFATVDIARELAESQTEALSLLSDFDLSLFDTNIQYRVRHAFSSLPE